MSIMSFTLFFSVDLYTLGLFFEFLKKKKFMTFLRIFFVFVNIGPYGNETFKALLLQIAAESVQTFPEFSSKWASQNHVWDF